MADISTWLGEIGLKVIQRNIRIFANGSMSLNDNEIPISPQVSESLVLSHCLETFVGRCTTFLGS